ncbi:Citrate lyase beta subunit [Trujillonella endophytica]|uniref:Citrate lyase beta subunit n=2 Tax=Trujillonella endophytica TaxID=673521 RepID=A0A1H8PIX0_9ACTN|nr:Citrate lyase beta subunit [Trujillella endophytica]
MRHFDHFSAEDEQNLFALAPQPFTRDDESAVLAQSLGATLYCPATRPALAKDIVRQRAGGLTSVVVCLEDAVADEDLEAAECNALDQLRELAALDAAGPLVFVRVRTPEQIPALVAGLGDAAAVLTGFVLPKFTARTGPAFLAAVAAASRSTGRMLRVMPVLESPELAHAESRTAVLLGVRDLLAEHREHVLAVRIGATDLSGAYGLRRSRELTVYDVRVVADVIADIVNVFGRADGSGHVITGPVWEYFPSPERMFKPQLRQTPFAEHRERSLRARLIARDLDGLIREVVLDRANGLVGKTVVHPSHVAAVHALSVVNHEEYADAVDVLGRTDGGAAASAYRNKMNESKPHAAWATRIVQRARVFGVARPETSFVDLLSAGLAA